MITVKIEFNIEVDTEYVSCVTEGVPDDLPFKALQVAVIAIALTHQILSGVLVEHFVVQLAIAIVAHKLIKHGAR